MNEACIYQDSFGQSFGQETPFLQFLREREEHAHWDKEPSNSLRFEALEEGSVITQLLRDNYVLNGKEEILTDTMENTRLLLRAKEKCYPVRGCAVRTILSRACISGSALNKLDKPVLAEVLNHCMKKAKGDALLRIADEKVSAVHGGDDSDYAVLPVPELFEHTAEYLKAEFRGATYAGGWYDHTMVTALWELPADEKMLGSYQSALAAHGKTADDLSPALRLTTSDVGISGANLYPMLFKGENSRMLTLGNPLKLSHENGADLVQFDKKLKMIFSQYSYGLKKLTDLLEVDIQYPENTLLGVMKQITIPKKLAFPAVDLFKAQYGDGSCTAHDLYYAISEILFMLQCDGASGARIAQMEENIAKALSVKWTEFDTSVPVNW